MISNVYRDATRKPGAPPWEPPADRRLERVVSGLMMDAETRNRLSAEDAGAVRALLASGGRRGKKLKLAFGHAIKIGMFTEGEADEVQELLDYRNDIAHRIHLVMSDISRSYWATDHVAYTVPAYKGDALDRLRSYRRSLWERVGGRLLLTLSMDRMLFELAEHAFEDDLKRLDRLIKKQIKQERQQTVAINSGA